MKDDARIQVCVFWPLFLPAWEYITSLVEMDACGYTELKTRWGESKTMQALCLLRKG